MRVIPPPDALRQALAAMAERPSGASARALYALVNTLDLQQAGCSFRLDRLRELDPEHRPIAYGLMESSVIGQVGDPDWQRTKAQMDRLIRGR
jgi:hypothetical protein